jgi:hypothetical protein
MLFKQNQEISSFSLDELFKEQAVATSLFTIPLPPCLNLKPSEIYERIRQIAAKRFNFILPE